MPCQFWKYSRLVLLSGNHYFPLWAQSTLPILDSSPLTLIAANRVFPPQLLFKYWSKHGTSPSTGVSSMKGHLHASCPKQYGKKLVPQNSYLLPSHYKLMTDDHHLLKDSSKTSPWNSGEKLSSLTSKLSTLSSITISCLDRATCML
jgi:hypothetical protein